MKQQRRNIPVKNDSEDKETDKTLEIYQMMKFQKE